MTGTGRGFTLLEVVVSMGIFSLLIIMAVSIFSHSTFLQRRQIAQQSLQEDMRLALDIFGREVRTGFGTTFNGGEGWAAFRNQNKKCVRFWLEDGALIRGEATAAIGVDCADPTLYAGDRITDGSNTFIENFSVRAAQAQIGSGGTPPRNLDTQGFMTVSVSARSREEDSNAVTLQTTVTSRQVNAY